jgi:TPR repeat protein
MAAQTPPPRGVEPERLTSLRRHHGERWAVIVGLSSYVDPKISPLKYADRDARSVYDFLISERAGLGGFKKENVRLLVNSAATSRNIRGALREFLKSATADDIVFIYFAGHGAPDPDRAADLYLMAYDTKKDSIASTGIPMTDVSDATRRVYAQDLFVFVDACHSGGVNDQPGTRGEITNTINDAFLKRLESTAPSQVTFTASEKNQVSREGPQWGGGHGVFTHFLLEGLKGGADEEGNGDQIVTLGELLEYVRSHVSRETRSAQVPAISPTSFDRDWPMAVVPKAVTTPVNAPTGRVTPAGTPAASGTRDIFSATFEAIDLSERGETAFQRGNFATALDPLTRACAGGIQASCSAEGMMYLNGLGVQRDETRARDLLKKACDSKDGRGCNGLGIVYNGGRGVPRDRARAVKLYEQACTFGYAAGCSNAGSAYAAPRSGFVDSIAARSLFRRGLDLATRDCAETGWACAIVGTILTSGLGVDTNTVRAADFLDRGCRSGSSSGCYELALAVLSGRGIKRDTARALDLHSRACDLGSGAGCRALARMYINGSGIRRDSTRALSLFERGCGLADANACVSQGYIVEHVGTPGLAEHQRALPLYRKGCELDEQVGCNNLGAMYVAGEGVVADTAKAIQLYSGACDNYMVTACSNLGSLYEKGSRKDVVKSLQYYGKGCDLDDASSCSSVSRLLLAGGVIPKDSVKAAEAKAKACRLGETTACKKS